LIVLVSFLRHHVFDFAPIVHRWQVGLIEFRRYATAQMAEAVILLAYSVLDVKALLEKIVRRRMIWNIRGDFGAEVIGSLGSGYAALR
jgi:hypothetical protein